MPKLETPSSRLVEFLLSLVHGDVAAEIIHQARIRLLDSLGCGLYGATMPWSKIAAQVVYEEKSHGRATVYGNSGSITPARAALVNGIAVHGFEFDDFAYGAHVHPGAVIIPAVLAVAEQHELSGMRLLTGVIAGYEAISRIGVAIGEAQWGFHITGIAGPAGAAIACGVTLDMPHEQIMNALGIACSNAAGIKSFTQGSGGMIKRMHAGRAAESGVLACLLARRGFTAPLAALDGKFGLLEVYGGENSDPHALDSNLGEHYAFRQVWTKVYPCSAGLHTAVQALHTLRIKHDIDPATISTVRIGTNERGLKLYAETAPQETMAAQYSLPFSGAVALAGDPKNPRSFTDGLNEAVVCELAQRVELFEDPEITAIYPRLGACVEVELSDGRKLCAKVLDAKGSPANPCGVDEIKDKVRCLASAHNSENSVENMLNIIAQLETLPSLAPLSEALGAAIVAHRQSPTIAN